MLEIKEELSREYTKKIDIGISACMYGAKFRYNGKGNDVVANMGRSKGDYNWHPVCPEVMSGMGVPRNPIRLVDGNGDDFWNKEARVKNKKGKNVTMQMKKGALACAETLEEAEVKTFIYMEGSPSCGIKRTTLRKESLGKPPGVFGSLLLKEEMFLISSTDCYSRLRILDWQRRLVAFNWLKEQSLEKKGSIVEIWHILKFLCQELDEIRARKIGKRLMDNVNNLEDREEVRREILLILRMNSTTNKIKQWVSKNYYHLEKKGIIVEGGKNTYKILGALKIADMLEKIMVESKKSGVLFGSFPIIYNPERGGKRNKGKINIRDLEKNPEKELKFG